MSRLGRLITFEGGEGAGKSTQIARLGDWLAATGQGVVTTREPGGTPGAEAIRSLLVTGEPGRWDPRTEMLLHVAARSDHVARVIRPALDAGRWVLSDRFSDSTRVYQGLAGGVGLDLVDRLHHLILGELEPDLTIVLDVDPALGLGRRGTLPGENRYERMGRVFHEQVRAGFLTLARQAPRRCVVIDGSPPVDAVAQAVWAAVSSRLGVPRLQDG